MGKIIYIVLFLIVPAFCSDLYKIHNTILEITKNNVYGTCNVDSEFETYEKCRETFNVTAFKEEIIMGLNNFDLPSTFVKYCKKVDVIIKCGTDLVESLKDEGCLNREDSFKLDRLLRVASRSKSLVCSDEGKLLEEMFLVGTDCMDKNHYALSQCTKNDLTTITSKTRIEKLEGLLCKMVENLDNCAVPILRECDEKTAASFVERLLAVIRAGDRCKLYENTVSTSTERHDMTNDRTPEYNNYERYLPTEKSNSYYHSYPTERYGYDRNYDNYRTTTSNYYYGPTDYYGHYNSSQENYNYYKIAAISLSVAVALLLGVCCCCCCKTKSNNSSIQNC